MLFKKRKIGLMILLLIITTAYVFQAEKSVPRPCEYQPFPAGATKTYQDTLEMLVHNTSVFFECKYQTSVGQLNEADLPPMNLCNKAANAVQYAFPGRCQSVDGDPCPPPRCLVSVLPGFVTKIKDSKIIIEDAQNGITECPAKLIQGQTYYYRFEFDKNTVSQYDSTFRISLSLPNGASLSRKEKF